jgi:hypothetical protein
LLPVLFTYLFVDLLVIPTEAVIAEAAFRVATFGAKLSATLLTVAKLLAIHPADLAERHL